MRQRIVNRKSMVLGILVFVLVGIFVWQGVTAQGNPDPTVSHLSPAAATLDTAILVLREGLEAILVLAALTAGLVRTKSDYWKPISVGAGLSFLATLITWFVVVGLISMVGATTSELNIQAGTGILANLVLLVIMNWFFHKIYWTGWISLHNRRKQNAIHSALQSSPAFTTQSLMLLGLTSVYREGFEVVLFLQTIRMQVGWRVVLYGALIGLAFVSMVGILTFFAHKRLPYKKMLILTGIMLCMVLAVMTGETVQEMQLAHWLPLTPLPLSFPAWMGLWLAVFPTVQGLVAQTMAVLFVVASYLLAEYLKVRKPRKQALAHSHSETYSATENEV